MIALVLLALASSPTDVACAAVKGDTKAVRRHLKTLPDGPKTKPLRGLALLLTGRKLAAARQLDGEPAFLSYRAMAQKDGPGGLGRARETLAASVDGDDAQSLFLAALAFWSAGQKDKADVLLKRSAASAASALGPAFAPEPANGLPAAVVRAGGTKGDLGLAGCLLDEGRVALALRIAEQAPDGAPAWRVKMRAWAAIDEREALRFAERIVRAEPDDVPAQVIRLRRWLDDGTTDRVRKTLATIDAPDDPAVARIEARLAIVDEDGRRALGAARQAARLDPKSDEAVALVVEALLLEKKPDQAAEFADVLLKRKPTEIDPHALIARVQKARGRTRGVRNEEMRSQLFEETRKKRRSAVSRREAIFAAVRDAEQSGRATGLAAHLDEDPTLSLSVDLAMARLSKGGAARAARDRILAACGPHLSRFLERSETWDRLRHGPGIIVPLSAANAERCARAAPMKARRRKKR